MFSFEKGEKGLVQIILTSMTETDNLSFSIKEIFLRLSFQIGFSLFYFAP